MGPGDLKHTLCNLKAENENILVGFDTSEDASVYKINETQAIVQTVDFITPVIDDPYKYGQIAAANSLSDVFAMGAEVKTALNIVGFDKVNLSSQALGEILRGGNDKIRECGGVLLGGHTIESPQMYYGLSVTGLIHPNKIVKNNTAKIGNVLVLTKPLGMGALTTAIKRDLLHKDLINHCADVMASLNYLPSQKMLNYDISSCTDITGFGLLGHSLECINKDISFIINSKEVPFINGSLELIQKGVFPGGTKKNKAYIQDKVSYANDVDDMYKTLLCDAQTSGGLLISMSEKDAFEYIKEIEDLGFSYAKIIGEVVAKQEKDIIIL